MTITNNTATLTWKIQGTTYYDGVLSPISPEATVTDVLLDTDTAWHMHKEPLFTSAASSDEPLVSERHAAVWATHMLTGEQMFTEAVVGKESFTFTQVQPVVEAFLEVAATGLITPTMGGGIDHHTKAFFHFKVGDDYRVVGDLHGKGLLLGLAHDGTASLSLRPDVVRYDCLNQVRAFGRYRSGRSLFSIRHTKSADLKVPFLSKLIVEAVSTLDGYDQMMRDMYERKVYESDFDHFLARLLPMPEYYTGTPVAMLTQGQKRSITMTENRRAAVADIYHNSPTQENLRGTAAGLFHAAVEASDHRFSGDRGRRMLFGRDEEFKNRAAELALAA